MGNPWTPQWNAPASGVPVAWPAVTVVVCETVVLGCSTALGAAVKIGSAETKIEMISSVEEGIMVDVEGMEDGGRVEERSVVTEAEVLDG